MQTTEEHLKQIIAALRNRAAENEVKSREAQTTASTYRDSADLVERELFRVEREQLSNPERRIFK